MKSVAVVETSVRIKATKRRDHYLPQGYLRGFIDPSRAKCPQPLWRYDVRHKVWSQRSTKGVGYQIGFYDYASIETELETADSAFLKLENNYPLIRAQMISNNFARWAEHRYFLLNYIQMMRARSLLFFEQKREEGKNLRALVIEEVNHEHRSVKVRSMTPVPVPDTFIRNRAIVQMREEIQKGASWLKDFNWALRYCDSPTNPFITGEIPFIVEGSCARLEDAMQHHDTLLFFPLCWQACLIGSRQFFHVETDRFASEDMRKIRRMYRQSANIFLVSPTKLDDL